ncbi:MAG TPA: LysR substrate-binding domain-containing protein, partial [Herpetosiphonaceae bacterium]
GELGTPLFDRVGKRVRLTEAGKHFLHYARQTLAWAHSGRQAVQDLADLQRGALAIGATYALRARLTPALIAFATRYPGIQLTVRFGTTDEVADAVRSGQVDVGLAFQGIADDPLLASQTLFESRLALVVAPTSPLADRTTMTLEEAVRLRLALPSQGYSTRQFLAAAVAARRLPLTAHIEVNDIPTLCALVATGQWQTILTLATVEQQPALIAIPLSDPDMTRQAQVIWPRQTHRTQAAIRFCALLMADPGRPAPAGTDPAGTLP